MCSGAKKVSAGWQQDQALPGPIGWTMRPGRVGESAGEGRGADCRQEVQCDLGLRNASPGPKRSLGEPQPSTTH